MGALEFLIAAMELVKAGAETATVAQQALVAIRRPGGPEDEDWMALHVAEDAMRARLKADPE